MTALQFLSGFSKLLQLCILADKELIGQMEVMKQLLSALVAVLMLDVKGLGQSQIMQKNSKWTFYSVILLCSPRCDLFVALWFQCQTL